MNFADF
jgi:hypothetical protein